MSEGPRSFDDAKAETRSLFPIDGPERDRVVSAAEQTPPPTGADDRTGFDTFADDTTPHSAIPADPSAGSSAEVEAIDSGVPRQGTSTSGVYAAIAGGGLPEPGQLIFDRYIVVRKIGEGGMGSVWLVRHHELGTERALKLIASGIAMDPQARARFRREARIMGRLSHINAVAIHDFRLARDAAYIEMEYVRGPSLNHLMKPDAPMPLDWTARILDQLCDVLQAAHEQGITHRDLKPSNLMLVEGRPPGKELLKVLDFGIAKIRDPDDVRTMTGNFIGTAHYSSPEQIRGEEVDGRSDLYSIGVILYELLTGYRPFTGSIFHLTNSHVHTPPPSFAARNPEAQVPAAVERVVMTCLAKDPAQRPQTARALSEAFQHALAEVEDDEPSVTRFDPVAQTTSPWTGTTQAHPELPAVAPGPDHPTELVTPTDQAPPEKPGPPSYPYPYPPPYPTPYPPGFHVPGKPPRNRLIVPAILILTAALIVAAVWFYRGRGQVLPGPLKEQLAAWRLQGFEPEDAKLLGWPDILVRKTDGARFRRTGRYYLPVGYEPSSETELEDNWPRTLTRSSDKARFIRIAGDSQPFTFGRVDDPDQTTAPAEEGTAVTLRGFYIQEREVNNGEMARWLGNRREFGNAWRAQYQKLKTRLGTEADDHPAVRVNWELASAFARTHGGRLPTEAQWEYTARSRGQNKAEVWGWNPGADRSLAIRFLANIEADAADDIGTRPGTEAPGESRTDRTFQGVRELAGNVREWTRERWRAHLSAVRVPLADPDESPDPQDGGDARIVVRGGSFATSTATRYTTYRSYALAKDAEADLGFRIVLECPEALRADDVLDGR